MRQSAPMPLEPALGQAQGRTGWSKQHQRRSRAARRRRRHLPAGQERVYDKAAGEQGRVNIVAHAVRLRNEPFAGTAQPAIEQLIQG